MRSVWVSLCITFAWSSIAFAQVKRETEFAKRTEVVNAALSSLKSSNVNVRKSACALLSSNAARPMMFKKQRVAVRNLVRSKHPDVSACMTRVLLNPPTGYTFSKSDLGAFKNAARSQDLQTSIFGIVGMAKAGASFETIRPLFPKTNAQLETSAIVEVLVHSSPTARDLLKRRLDPNTSDSTVFQALAAFPKTKKLDVTDPATFKATRDDLMFILKGSQRSVSRAVLVSAVLAFGPSPKEVVDILEHTEGYFEHLSIFSYIKNHWGPEETWAVPRLMEELNRDDPLVFELIAALDSMKPNDFHGFIGWALARFIDHKDYGMAVRLFLPTLQTGASYTVKILKGEGGGKEAALVTQAALKECNRGLLQVVRANTYDDPHLQLAALSLRHRCGEDVAADVIAIIDRFPQHGPMRTKGLTILLDTRTDLVLDRLDVIPVDPTLVDAPTIIGWVVNRVYPIDQALKHVAAPEAERLLVESLGGSVDRQEAALLALGFLESWSVQTTATVATFLKEQPTRLSRSAALALSRGKRDRSNAPELLSDLETLTRSGDRDTSTAALLAMANLAPTAAEAKRAAKAFPLEDRLAKKFDWGAPTALCVISPKETKARLLAFRKISVAIAARALVVCPTTPKDVAPFMDLLTETQPRKAIRELVLKHGNTAQVKRVLELVD